MNPNLADIDAQSRILNLVLEQASGEIARGRARQALPPLPGNSLP